MLRMDTVFAETLRDFPSKDRELEISSLVPIPKKKSALEQLIRKIYICSRFIYIENDLCT
ncbi:hypothetical protein [Heyndrickxia ginsengihumi]|uniref:hypothetical protein n=1 Tax=Heyndrickxia ginsengihumi TaxID=363870 RepID=UPI003D216537